MQKNLKSWLVSMAIGCIATAGYGQIQLIGITEATGAGAAAGGSFKNGYLLALEEVNASGGVLGQQLVLTQFDIDTKADAAVEATKKAVAAKPFAILGPVFSGLTLASMQYTSQPRIPHFTGGEAASLTRKFHPSLMRTSLSQLGSAPRLGALVTRGLNAKKVGLMWIDNEFGRDGKAALVSVIKNHKATVSFDFPVKPGQKDFSQAVEQLKAADVDALLLYANEGESIEILKEIKKQGFQKPIVSDGLVASQKVIDGAAGGAEGVFAHMNTFTDAPIVQMRAFAKRYTAKYGVKPDQNSVKGFFVIQLIKAGLEQSGKVDSTKFLDILKNTHFDSKRFPDLISSVSYDFFGDLNRESYFVMIRDNQPQLLASIRSIDGGYVELPNGRQLTLNSNEFRRELTAGSAAGVTKVGTKK
jgi:branched-chain amino acid transport system substrate-binding protein